MSLLGKFISVREPNIKYLGLENMVRLAEVPAVADTINRCCLFARVPLIQEPLPPLSAPLEAVATRLANASLLQPARNPIPVQQGRRCESRKGCAGYGVMLCSRAEDKMAREVGS